MKRTTILILICLFLVSCSKKERLLSQAKRDAKEMIEKKAMEPKNKKQIVEQMKKILEHEGIITIKTHNDGFWWKSRIKFKMNLAGYNEAKRLLE